MPTGKGATLEGCSLSAGRTAGPASPAASCNPFRAYVSRPAAVPAQRIDTHLTAFGQEVTAMAAGEPERRRPRRRLRRTTTLSAEERWRRKDTQLATEFAQLWDRAVMTTDRPRWRQLLARLRGGQARRLEADLIQIEDAIRAWTIRCLLASERPRALHDFPLLRLACMYRLVHRCRDGSASATCRCCHPGSGHRSPGRSASSITSGHSTGGRGTTRPGGRHGSCCADVQTRLSELDVTPARTTGA